MKEKERFEVVFTDGSSIKTPVCGKFLWIEKQASIT